MVHLHRGVNVLRKTGVKWSQVQILSARHRSEALDAD